MFKKKYVLDEILYKVKRLDLKEGSTVVITFETAVSVEHIDELKRILWSWSGNRGFRDIHFIILPEGGKITNIINPTAEMEADIKLEISKQFEKYPLKKTPD